MQKVIIDTNVIISALIQHSYPYFIIHDFLLEGRIDLCISKELFSEYLDVLSRPKFKKYQDFISKAESVLAQIEDKAKIFEPNTKIDVISDKDDNKLLELAVESEADFIITGNTNDFTINEFQGTRIVSPKEYWEFFRF
jgi:putative PIN family toxin of toxin-antitoxin system